MVKYALMLLLVICVWGCGKSGKSESPYEKEYREQGARGFIQDTEVFLEKKEYREAANRLSWFLCSSDIINSTTAWIAKQLIAGDPQAKVWLRETQKKLYDSLLTEKYTKKSAASLFAKMHYFFELSQILDDSPSPLSEAIDKIAQVNPDVIADAWLEIEEFAVKEKKYALAKRCMDNGDYSLYFRRQLTRHEYRTKYNQTELDLQFKNKLFAQKVNRILEVMRYDHQTKEAEIIRAKALEGLKRHGFTGPLDPVE